MGRLFSYPLNCIRFTFDLYGLNAGERVALEEEFLRRELKGYEEYTKRVRYRLIPFLW